ncbi:MAG TPA: carbon starvation CstA family protein [Candidatus Omnitrophota bacterium]|nr:carbon starvation CstA family protein [Candidatus Omnitrophota bacterium]
MNLLFLVLCSIILLLLGYYTYGIALAKWFKLSDANVTPAHCLRDNQDFVPTPKFYLVNQHLSAIAAAGPIVGPILAGMWFGWLPTFFWIVLGGIFIGGVHDFLSLLASVRHQGRSIAEIIKETMGQKAFIIFLLFLWFSLVYIIAAFTDVTSSTFAEAQHGASIASSSMLYLLLAFIMGLILKIFKPPLMLATFIFLPLVFVCIWLGPYLPLNLPSLFGLNLRMSWNIMLLAYCFMAAVIPVWVLLQPRGYLGGFFLTLTAVVSFIGLVIGSFTHTIAMQYPAFVSWNNPQGLPLLPLLFTTVACGACSGFHCLIASGTTSKQLNKESDVRFVAYGGMLMECFVAVMALSCLIILSTTQAQELKDPNQIFAHGVAAFISTLGINKEFALNFALLAFATFVYDTLDVATRLGRYIFEELTGWKNKWSPYVAAALTLVLPLWFLTRTFTDAQGNPIAGWKMFWTVFGSSNQLLAAMVLFGLAVWLFKLGQKFRVALLPSVFMIVVAVSSLFLIIRPWLGKILQGNFSADPVGLTCIALFILTGFLLIEGAVIFLKGKKNQ